MNDDNHDQEFNPEAMESVEQRPFCFPTHCWWCGAFLMGGRTVHASDCTITEIIAKANALPDEHLPLE